PTFLVLLLSFKDSYCIIAIMSKKKKTTKADQKLHIEVVRQMLTLATTGFGLVAALAWNNLIRETVDGYIKPYLPEGSTIISLLIYALVVTIIAVVVTFQLSKVLKRLEGD